MVNRLAARAANIMSPSIFSLPLMNSIGPAAFPVTRRRKSAPPMVKVTRAPAFSKPSWASQVPALITVSYSSVDPCGPPPIRQWITASVSPAASARKCSSMRPKISFRISPRIGLSMSWMSCSSLTSAMFLASSFGSIWSRSIPWPPLVAACSSVLIAPPPSPLRSLDVHARDRARDHQPLDLRCALEDVVDLRVAVHPLDRVLAGVAVAAEDLDRALGDPNRDLARLELRHRALGVGELVSVATHPRCPPDE